MTCKLLIEHGNKTEYFEMKKGDSIADTLSQTAYALNLNCGAKGRCGKCRVLITKGAPSANNTDLRFLSTKEIEKGYRIGCRCYPLSDVTVSCDDPVQLNVTQNITSECGLPVSGLDVNTSATKSDSKNSEGDMGTCIAIDVGSTTLAFQAINGNECLPPLVRQNSGIKYGGDVLSRIEQAKSGKAELIKEIMLNDLAGGIHELANIICEYPSKIVLSGNTTMMHLLMGYDTAGLGEYPFTAVDLDYKDTTDLKDALLSATTGPKARNNMKDTRFDLNLHSASETRVFITPGISAYVGGDIVSGLLSLDFDKNEKTCVLIDLGTNAEMAIGNKDKIVVASAAAGPTFEGGNLKCGMPSIPGAICGADAETHEIAPNNATKDSTDDKSVCINRNINLQGYNKNFELKLRTISGTDPKGICGTGAIEILAELIKAGIIDKTGALREEYTERGFPIAEGIVFTAKDIRELQVAKSAIRSGLEILIKEYGCSYAEVEKVYLAGGFGYSLSPQKACAIGLLPPAWEEKIIAAGNTSLKGAAIICKDETAKERIQKIISLTTECELALHADFGEEFMENMGFVLS